MGEKRGTVGCRLHSIIVFTKEKYFVGTSWIKWTINGTSVQDRNIVSKRKSLSNEAISVSIKSSKTQQGNTAGMKCRLIQLLQCSKCHSRSTHKLFSQLSTASHGLWMEQSCVCWLWVCTLNSNFVHFQPAVYCYHNTLRPKEISLRSLYVLKCLRLYHPLALTTMWRDSWCNSIYWGGYTDS